MILSPTQIETFDPSTTWGCQRKWWYGWVKGLKGPQDKSMALGESVHSTIEEFLKGGPVGGLHDLALPGAEYLSRLRPRVKLIEKKIEPGELEIAGETVIGRIDCVATRGEVPEIIDWKTTSDVGRYAKTAGQLQESTQMIVYAEWLMQFDVAEIYLTHGYFQTKRAKKFELVDTTVTRSHVEKRVEIIAGTIELMKGVHEKKTPDEVQPDESKCNLGFGCPHRAYCPRSGDPMASLLDSFRNLSPGGVAPAEIVPPAAPAPVSTGILAPDAPKSDPALAADPVVAAPKRESFQIKDLSTPVPVAAAAPVGPPPAALEQPKRGPGRPKGTANKPKAIEVAEPLPPASPLVTAPDMRADKATAAQVTRIQIRHGAKIGMPNFSSATVEVEYDAIVTGNVEAAREWVSLACRAAMLKELEIYKSEAERKALEKNGGKP